MLINFISIILSVIVIPYLAWITRSIFMLKTELVSKLDVRQVQELIDLNQRSQDIEIKILFKELKEIKEILQAIERDLRAP